MRSLTVRERFLSCALADDETWQAMELESLWRETGEEEAWDFCGRNDARSIVGAALARILGEACVPVRWLQERDQTVRQLQLYLEQLDRVAAALANEGIRLVALKNSGIARGIYADWGGCPMGDIDVLVDPREFRRAHACLLSLGYTLNSRSPLGEKNLAEAEQSGGTEYEFRLRNGSMLWFELQWRPVAGRWIQEDQEPAAADLLARSREMPGTQARLLAPIDNLMQVCLHTAKHSYVRAPGFRLHTDVDRIVRRCEIDWPAFVDMAAVMRVNTAVYYALQLPSQLLRTPVPPWVLARLRPSMAKDWLITGSLWRAGLFCGEERKWSKGGYIWFNLLLYDDLGGLWRAVFPPVRWMKRRYQYRHAWTLPWWYVARIGELLFKRART